MRNESKFMHQGEITRNRINASFKNTRNISKAKASQIIGFWGQYLSSFRTMILQQSMELRLHCMKPYSFLSSKFPLISFFFFFHGIILLIFFSHNFNLEIMKWKFLGQFNLTISIYQLQVLNWSRRCNQSMQVKIITWNVIFCTSSREHNLAAH
jgi:hypothetical protein